MSRFGVSPYFTMLRQAKLEAAENEKQRQFQHDEKWTDVGRNLVGGLGQAALNIGSSYATDFTPTKVSARDALDTQTASVRQRMDRDRTLAGRADAQLVADAEAGQLVTDDPYGEGVPLETDPGRPGIAPRDFEQADAERGAFGGATAHPWMRPAAEPTLPMGGTPASALPQAAANRIQGAGWGQLTPEERTIRTAQTTAAEAKVRQLQQQNQVARQTARTGQDVLRATSANALRDPQVTLQGAGGRRADSAKYSPQTLNPQWQTEFGSGRAMPFQNAQAPAVPAAPAGGAGGAGGGDYEKIPTSHATTGMASRVIARDLWAEQNPGQPPPTGKKLSEFIHRNASEIFRRQGRTSFNAPESAAAGDREAALNAKLAQDANASVQAWTRIGMQKQKLDLEALRINKMGEGAQKEAAKRAFQVAQARLQVLKERAERAAATDVKATDFLGSKSIRKTPNAQADAEVDRQLQELEQLTTGGQAAPANDLDAKRRARYQQLTDSGMSHDAAKAQVISELGE